MVSAIVDAVARIDTIIVLEGNMATAELGLYMNLLEGVMGVQGPFLRMEHWPGGWVVYHDSRRMARVAAERVVEFLLPVERVVAGLGILAMAGQFTRPLGANDYILILTAGALLPAMVGDLRLVAVDLSAVDARRLRPFQGCLKLTFVRLPAVLEVIPAFALEGCAALVEVDLAGCKALRQIGEQAFCGCSALQVAELPPSIGGLGRWSFFASGVRSVTAVGPNVEVGQGAFIGCRLLSRVRFGIAKLSSTIFTGCDNLREVSVERVEASELYTLYGSSVSSLAVGGVEGVCKKLVEVLNPAGQVSFKVNWAIDQRGSVWPMTDLIVSSGPCAIEESHRRCLSSVDLSGLARLPQDLSFERCFFLQRVRLPTCTERITRRVFAWCQKLRDMNLE
jgi:hypothetical protein